MAGRIPPNAHNPWRFTGARTLYVNRWIRLEALEGTAPNGAPADYTVVRYLKHAVGVLPITSEGAVHLVGQWRVPLARYSWEMPEGGVEPGEDIAAAAVRECAEEIGVRPGRLLEALKMDLSNSVSDEEATCYLGFDLAPAERQPEGTEVLAHRVAPFAQVLAEAKAGLIRDSMTVATLFRAHHMALTGEIESDLARAMLSDQSRDLYG
jgi:8-oxo-dGTP pyrophosphatase MutT (NUDIX family)